MQNQIWKTFDLDEYNQRKSLPISVTNRIYCHKKKYETRKCMGGGGAKLRIIRPFKRNYEI